MRREIVEAIDAEIERAKALYGDESMSGAAMNAIGRLGVLMEEFQEVLAAIRSADIDGPHGLRAELTQVAACAVAWLSTLPAPESDVTCCGYGCEDCVCVDTPPRLSGSTLTR